METCLFRLVLIGSGCGRLDGLDISCSNGLVGGSWTIVVWVQLIKKRAAFLWDFVLHFPWYIAVYVVVKSSVINMLEFRDLGGGWVSGGRCRHCCLGDQGS